MTASVVSIRSYIDCDGFDRQRELVANVYQDHSGCTWYGYALPLWGDIGHPGVGYRVRIKRKPFLKVALASLKRWARS